MKKGQEVVSIKGESMLLPLVLVAIIVIVLCLCAIRDYGKGMGFAREAGELGMLEADAEQYRLDCLAAQKEGDEPPSPYDWARANAKAFEPLSVLDCMSHTLWLAEEEEKREAEHLRLQQEEIERFQSSSSDSG